jgi:hypothetical protein
MATDSCPPPAAVPATHRDAGVWLRLCLSSGALGGAAVLAWAVTLPAVPLCTFKLWTGRPCPGCGMTRAFVSLAQGDLARSIVYHPLGVVLFGLAAAAFLGALSGLLRGKDPVWRLATRHAPVLAAGVLGALLVVWVVRAFVFPEFAPDPVGWPY